VPIEIVHGGISQLLALLINVRKTAWFRLALLCFEEEWELPLSLLVTIESAPVPPRAPFERRVRSHSVRTQLGGFCFFDHEERRSDAGV
jgi:hypothetical protein